MFIWAVDTRDIRQEEAIRIQYLVTQFLDDNNSQDREFGINAGLSLLSECDELWYFGDRVTRGMTNEICFALKHGIRVKYIPEHLYEQYKTERTMTHEM